MDIHGAFVLAAGMSAPTDTQFRADRVRTQLRVARILGRTVQANRPAPAGPPEAIGLVLVAMLEQAWYQLRVLRAPVAEHEVVEALAGIVAGTRTTPDG